MTPMANLNDNIIIHIGFHKTGTSWLQKKFFENPVTNINSLAKYKERAKWVTEIIKPFYLYDEAKLLEFINDSYSEGKLNVFSLERLAGYPSTGGYDSLMIAKRLKSLFPNAKILIGIREQFSMIKSHYLEYLKANGTARLDELMSPPRFYLIRNPVFQLEYFFYKDLIEEYDLLFSKENVLVIPYELMSRDPFKYIEYICKFLDIPDYEDFLNQLPFQERINEKISARDAYLNRTYNRIFGSNNSLVTVTSNKFFRFLFSTFYKRLPLDFGKKLESEIKHSIESIPSGFFKDSNKLLEKRMNYHFEVNLQELGYY